MLIKTLSEKRGIIAFYDGDKYIIYSTCYGVVAESKPIKRYYYDENNYIHHLDHIKIEFEICNWFGYWSLTSVINRGIKKLEREDCHVGADICYHIHEHEQMKLNRRLVINTEPLETA